MTATSHMPARLGALCIAVSMIGTPVLAQSPQTGDALTLFLYGPEIAPFFRTSSAKKDFAWSEIIAAGSTGIGTTTRGAGEVVGVDGDFYIALPDDPTPRQITDEGTPSGTVITFEPQHTLTIKGPVDLEALQDALDQQFVDTKTFVYMFQAHGTLVSVEYQLEPKTNDAMLAGIKAGDSQKALATGSVKYTATDVPATLIGIRAPSYFNTIFEIPYHIHFLSDDRSVLGHVTALKASDLDVAWLKADDVNIRYWELE